MIITNKTLTLSLCVTTLKEGVSLCSVDLVGQTNGVAIICSIITGLRHIKNKEPNCLMTINNNSNSL